MGPTASYSHSSVHSSVPAEQNKEKDLKDTIDSLTLIGVAIAVSGIALSAIALFAHSPVAFVIGALVAMLGHDIYRISDNIEALKKMTETYSVKISSKEPFDFMLRKTMLLSKLPLAYQKKTYNWICGKKANQ